MKLNEMKVKISTVTGTLCRLFLHNWVCANENHRKCMTCVCIAKYLVAYPVKECVLISNYF